MNLFGKQRIKNTIPDKRQEIRMESIADVNKWDTMGDEAAKGIAKRCAISLIHLLMAQFGITITDL